MTDNKIRVALVIGDNPEELLHRYDSTVKVEPYVVYRYLESEKMQKTAIKCTKQLLDNAEKIPLSKFQVDYLTSQLKSLSSLTPFEYYVNLTRGEYTFDEEGNAVSDRNPQGRFSSYNMGGNFSYPLICNDGSEKYQCKADEVDWLKMHMRPEAVNYFDTVWQLVKEKKEPIDDETKKLRDEWETRFKYFENFKTKEEFIKHNCAYWTYFVITKDGIFSVDDDDSEDKWIMNFMDRFIHPLKDEQITIYEVCLS